MVGSVYMSRDRLNSCAHVTRVNTCDVGCSKEKGQEDKQGGEMQPRVTCGDRMRIWTWERFISTLGGQL